MATLSLERERRRTGPRCGAQYSAFGLKIIRVFVFFAVDFGEPAIFCRGVRGLGGALELFTGKRQLAFTERSAEVRAHLRTGFTQRARPTADYRTALFAKLIAPTLSPERARRCGCF